MVCAVCLQALFGQLSPDVMVLTVLYSLAGEELGLGSGLLSSICSPQHSAKTRRAEKT
jgi:hypothetical protein